MYKLIKLIACVFFGSALASPEVAAIVEKPMQAYFCMIKNGCPAAVVEKKINDAFACATVWQKFALMKSYMCMYERYIRPMKLGYGSESECGDMGNWMCGNESGWMKMRSSGNGWMRGKGMGSFGMMNHDNNQHCSWSKMPANHAEIKKFFWTVIEPKKQKLRKTYMKWKKFNAALLRYKQKQIMRQFHGHMA